MVVVVSWEWAFLSQLNIRTSTYGCDRSLPAIATLRVSIPESPDDYLRQQHPFPLWHAKETNLFFCNSTCFGDNPVLYPGLYSVCERRKFSALNSTRPHGHWRSPCRRCPLKKRRSASSKGYIGSHFTLLAGFARAYDFLLGRTKKRETQHGEVFCIHVY